MREIDSGVFDSPLNTNSSKLLIYEGPLQVLPSLAVKIGLNEAIILQQIHYWISNELNRNVIGGRKWVYNSYKDWKKQFPFWGKNTIVRTIDSLENKKLLISGAFNKLPRDRTKWYTIDYESLKCLEVGNSSKNDDSKEENADSPIYPNWVVPFTQNGYMHLPKMGKCNTKDYLPEITKDLNVRNANFDNEFEEFWNCYDKKADKKKCGKAYVKLLTDKGVDLHDIIMNALSAQKKSRDAADALGIWQPFRKQPLTWLNGNCWEDEVKTQEQLNEERKRVSRKVPNKPMGMSTFDQYHIINDKIRESAEAEIVRSKRAEALERGEEWEWDGSSSSLGIPDF